MHQFVDASSTYTFMQRLVSDISFQAAEKRKKADEKSAKVSNDLARCPLATDQERRNYYRQSLDELERLQMDLRVLDQAVGLIAPKGSVSLGSASLIEADGRYLVVVNNGLKHEKFRLEFEGDTFDIISSRSREGRRLLMGRPHPPGATNLGGDSMDQQVGVGTRELAPT